MWHQIYDRLGTLAPQPCHQSVPRWKKGGHDVRGPGTLEGVDLKQSVTTLANATCNII
jgi:hypothetical protein